MGNLAEPVIKAAKRVLRLTTHAAKAKYEASVLHYRPFQPKP
jgi:hypothetical protein